MGLRHSTAGRSLRQKGARTQENSLRQRRRSGSIVRGSSSGNERARPILSPPLDPYVESDFEQTRPMPGNPILLCAPESDLRVRLERELTASGYPVSSVYTPADAVAALRDARFDLVVADGLAVTGALASIRNASTIPTPCLVVAPAGDVEARIAFLEAGADDVLPAGWGHRELEARIEALLIRSGRVQPADRSTAPGQVVTFFSPKGGVGTTTLAVNTALLL